MSKFIHLITMQPRGFFFYRDDADDHRVMSAGGLNFIYKAFRTFTTEQRERETLSRGASPLHSTEEGGSSHWFSQGVSGFIKVGRSRDSDTGESSLQSENGFYFIYHVLVCTNIN